MAYTQDDHSIAIATPLGKDKLLLKSCTIKEQLGRPFVIKAQLLSEEPAVNFQDLIGAGVTLRWRMPELSGGQEERYFSGYVSSFVQRPRADGFNTYEAIIVPWLWFLTRTADCRIFHSAMTNPPEEMTVPGILKKVFKDHRFDDVTPALTGSYRKLDHCVQYRETDFNFVSRLMEQEGIYYFFEHVKDGNVIKHKLKLVDAMSAHAEYPEYETVKYRGSEADPDNKGNILTWSRVKQVQPGTYKVDDFDFKRPKTSLLGGGTQDRQHANSGFEIYDFAANFADEDPGDYGDKYGKLRIEELQAQHDIVLGQSDCPGLVCGSKFTLEEHPRSDENSQYLVVGVSYQCISESYKSAGAQSQGRVGGKRFLCDFTAIPANSVFRPARLTSKPRIGGPQTAIVVGKAGEEILTDEFGRVKVQFHWDRYSPANENSPCWARVSQLWAGKNWGTVFLPRIGQEVIVEFLDGNPDRPIITGSVYNGESKPPYALPDKATVTTIKSNSSKGGQGFNELRFEDKKGSEQIFLHAEKDQEIRVKNDAKEWIGKDRHLIVKGNQCELVEKDQSIRVKGDQLVKVEGNLGRTVTKDEIAKISGNEHVTVTGDYVAKIGGNLHEKVTGNHHDQTTGDIRLAANGNVYIKSSQNAAVEGGMNVHVKGGMVVVVEGGMQLSLKAGGSFIDIGPAGVTIQGTMVKLNMGGAAGSGSGAQAASPSSPNAPDAATDATEAADADAGSSDAAPAAPTAPQPDSFSPAAMAMQEAASSGAPTVAQPTDPAEAASASAANATAAAATANAAATSATTAATAATAAATAASSAASTATGAAATAASNAATAASGAANAATTAASNATAAASGAAAAATNASNAATAATANASNTAAAAGASATQAATAASGNAAAAAGAADNAAATANAAAASATAAAGNAYAAAASANTAAAAAAASAPAAALPPV